MASPKMRKNKQNALAGLWEHRMARFNPFQPDEAVYRLALNTKLPNHKSVSSELRGVTLGNIPEDQLEVWANIPDEPMMLHINYPAMIISSVRACEACLDMDERLAMLEYFQHDCGFSKASI